jgi:hypothetical protein
MKRFERLILAVVLAAVSGCASARYDALVGHAVEMCKELRGPDAAKGEEEARFWFQSERNEASRKLWNRRGLAAVQTRQASSDNPTDVACLAQLHQEASTRQLVRD